MDLHNLKLKLDAHFPIIVIETHDEQRVQELLITAVKENNKLGTLRVWSASHGLDLRGQVSSSRWQVEGLEYNITSKQQQDDLTDPLNMLKAVKEYAKDNLILLPDFHSYLSNPMILRLIKEIAQ
jgi:hypothetical protein